jgi:hypothetical protein
MAGGDRSASASGRYSVTAVDVNTVVARKVLLDALDALSEHLSAIVVVGAQAVYLRTGSSDLAVAAYTFDGDLVLDPTLLGDNPLLEQVMSDAGFTILERRERSEPGTWVTTHRVGTNELIVPIDLIVPEAFAPVGGRRSVQLGPHDKMSVRRTHGLEAALVDHGTMSIGSLDPSDMRSIEVQVAGPAALLVAKLHKLHDRAEPGQRRDRLRDKDAADVYRLMQNFNARLIGTTIVGLRDHPLAGPATVEAIGYLEDLFIAPRSQGTLMAIEALRTALPATTISALATAWTRAILSSLVENRNV